MITILNKNTQAVPTDIIDAAVNAYEQGEQETYNLGVFANMKISNDHSSKLNFDIETPSI